MEIQFGLTELELKALEETAKNACVSCEGGSEGYAG